MRPSCSTTNTRFGSRRGAATWTGMTNPDWKSTASSVAPDPVGTPAQSAGFTLSSWQVGEHPSPAVRLPSSHSSAPSATPLPQAAGIVVVVLVVVVELVVVVLVSVVLVVVVDGWTPAATSATNASTFDSIGPASPLVVQPPLPSALEKAAVRLLSHRCRQGRPTGTPRLAAVELHL